MSARVVPRVPQDLTLAPVAVSIDRNLELLREQKSVQDVLSMLELELNTPERAGNPTERAERILEMALRNVDLHGWNAEVTPDYARIRIAGGSVTLDLGLSKTIIDFISSGS